MYSAISDLLLNGVRYTPGQSVDVTGLDARTIARLVEQRRLISMAPAPDSKPARKAHA
jgi:hypothetical protein